jgi:mannose-1-phosphate guanylyltransferase
MNPNNYAVIMAGGVGTRFWPISKTSHPKQFLDFLNTGKTLIQQTYSRFLKIVPPENIFVVTNEAYRDIIKKQLKNIPDSNILGEPTLRNTAPCIAYAMYKIHKINPEANCVIAPSDHLILDETEFTRIINLGFDFTDKKDALVTLGIKPSRPDTGYGYIQFFGNIKDGICKVKTFTEKPTLEIAREFLESGEFLWNAGIFIWKSKTILNAIENLIPDIATVFQKGRYALNTDQEKEFINTNYPTCENISIDYGVMEKASNVNVIPSDFGWSDLGTWGSVYEQHHKDGNANTITGKNVVTYETQNCVIHIQDPNKLFVIKGIENAIIVESDNVVLICNKDKEQEIKNIVADMKATYGEKYV